MRAFLPKGEQKKFINRIFSRISVRNVTKLCNLSERTIRDWRREKFSMDFGAIQKLCRKTGVSIPSNIKLKDRYWYVAHGGLAGGLAVLKKYGRIGGDPEYRKKKWYEWWEREGRYRNDLITGITKPIRKPPFSKKLAEFVGIVMGDGGITKAQITITLHRDDDRAYGKFVVMLIKRLFYVPVGTYFHKNYAAVNFVVSRTELVKFCTEKLGLKVGNKVKQQIDIPNWIKQNRRYSVSCVRGLIDTDGSIFTHSYRVNGKLYSYKKLSFTTHSQPLRQSVYSILRRSGLNPRLARNVDVRLDSKEDMRKYFQIIGSHNPKHLKRYRK